jgi:hypothetical protein
MEEADRAEARAGRIAGASNANGKLSGAEAKIIANFTSSEQGVKRTLRTLATIAAGSLPSLVRVPLTVLVLVAIFPADSTVSSTENPAALSDMRTS